MQNSKDQTPSNSNFRHSRGKLLINNHRSQIFNHIIKKSLEIAYMNARLRSKLKDEIANNCWVGNCTDLSCETLLIFTLSAAMRYQIEKQIPHLLNNFKSDPKFKHFTKIKVTISPELIYLKKPDF